MPSLSGKLDSLSKLKYMDRNYLDFLFILLAGKFIAILLYWPQILQRVINAFPISLTRIDVAPKRLNHTSSRTYRHRHKQEKGWSKMERGRKEKVKKQLIKWKKLHRTNKNIVWMENPVKNGRLLDGKSGQSPS